MTKNFPSKCYFFINKVDNKMLKRLESGQHLLMEGFLLLLLLLLVLSSLLLRADLSLSSFLTILGGKRLM